MRSFPLIIPALLTFWSAVGLGVSLYFEMHTVALFMLLTFAACGYITAVQVAAKWPKENRSTCKLNRRHNLCYLWRDSDSGCSGCSHFKIDKQ